jgi:NitT/TauT family transport system ATP-binding protein
MAALESRGRATLLLDEVIQVTNDPPLCELRGVSQEYAQPKGGGVLRVLSDVSLEIRANEVIALLGPSGCGKSTILRILTGLTRPTRGEVRYHGAPLRGLNPGIGFVFQSFALFPWMTVRENLESVLHAARVPRDQICRRAEQAIALVGLAGTEDAYPRELSGGMKQRVGIARALSLDPEMLFMDEPFSQVDALIAEGLRADVLEIWARPGNPSSIVMVSHDIKEVVSMADRIVVLDAKPGRIHTIIDNALPRPRNARSTEFSQLVDKLHDIITGSEMPDLPVEHALSIELLPAARASEVIGLLEYLDAHGGREDVFRIASDTHREYGNTIAAVNAAELLDFIDSPRRTVMLEPLGKRFVGADAMERKTIWRQQLLRLVLFKKVAEAIERQPKRQVDADFVLETIAMLMPNEDYERVFGVFTSWARYGDLFAYDEMTRLVTTTASSPR